MNRALAWMVALAVGAAGAAVMTIEVAGAQVLAPDFGIGLYAWAAMITVALGGLALGYALGGLLADRWDRHAHRLLAGALALAGITCSTDPLLWDAEAVVRLARLGPRFGAALTAATLFLPAFIGLGVAYPLAVKLWTRRVDEVGRRAGWLSAASALGSLLGAGLAGFVLVPTFALETVFAGTAAALLIMAAGVLLLGSRARLTGAALLALACWPLCMPSAPLPESVLCRRGSLFGPLEVWQSGILRHLLVARSIQAISTGDPPTSYMPYTRMISGMLFHSVHPERHKVLVIGLGAGFIPRELDPIPCETVEIDPAVVQAAETYFAFDRRKFPVHEMDGRAFLRTQPGPYEAVVIDAFRGFDLPHHLVTRRCFQLIKRRLHPEGILVLNFHGFLEGEHDRLARSLEATLRAVFDRVEVAVCMDTPPHGNAIFAAYGPDAFVEWPQNDRYTILRRLEERSAAPPAESAVGPALVLTDSPNPVALWCARTPRRREVP